MKRPSSSLPRSRLLAAVLLGSVAATAEGTFVFDFANLNGAIPDASSSGLYVTRQLRLPPAPVAKVTVRLGILPRDGSSVFNGDLYVGLTHGDEYAVLLNRVGRRGDSALGYGDNGFQVRFDDGAAGGDIHAYRLAVSGDHTAGLQPQGAPLDGVWAPDGRKVNPATVLLSDPRTALLDAFNGRDANGAWTLFVADWETGGLAKLDRWALEITLVPEPAWAGCLTGVGLLAWGVFSRWKAKGWTLARGSFAFLARR